jgi:hypothetical protein
VLAGDAAERVADRWVAAVEGVARLPVRAGDGGQAPAQGGEGVAPGVGREVGGEGGGRGRQRREAGLQAPGVEVAPVGGVGAARVPGASARPM